MNAKSKKNIFNLCIALASIAFLCLHQFYNDNPKSVDGIAGIGGQTAGTISGAKSEIESTSSIIDGAKNTASSIGQSIIEQSNLVAGCESIIAECRDTSAKIESIFEAITNANQEGKTETK